MADAEANMKVRNRSAKREDCYAKTKSGKKGRMFLTSRDKQKCDKKHQ